MGAVTLAAFSSMVAVSFNAQARAEPGTLHPVDGIAMLVGLTAAGFLVARRRWPVPLTLAAAASAVVLPLDTVTALIALPWVFATAARRVAWWCTGAVAVATAIALWRDGSRDPADMVLSTRNVETGQLTSFNTVGLILVGLVCVGAAVAAGLVRSSGVLARQAVAAYEGQSAQVETLHDRMTRQEERELIAREVHDTVAHHISRISLQASALEVQNGATSDDVKAAAQQRSSAQQAIAEMRGLITTLRTGDDASMAGTTLDDLATLLDGARRQGRWVTSSVFVTDAHTAPPALTRATFRIVQEGLTNALKHAPGEPVEVTIRAGSMTGVDVRIINPMPATAPVGVVGTGSGLTGMRERAALLGGTVVTRIDGGWHVLEAHLPWVSP
ncbi:sensor histidine kinase [Cellulomonas algicola]|nr:histidine kinase [Cellulomonas algicola]